MVNVSPSLSVSVNPLNGLNCPSKRLRLAEWFIKSELLWNNVYKWRDKSHWYKYVTAGTNFIWIDDTIQTEDGWTMNTYE